jgi:hypothetical protein
MTALLTQNLAFFSDEAWSHLNEYISTQNSMYWKSINKREILKCPFKSEDWCVVCHYCGANSSFSTLLFESRRETF